MKEDGAEPTLLQMYGEEVAHYNGRGKIELRNSQTMDCDFQAAQFENGSIVVLIQWKGLEVPENYVELILDDDWRPQRLVGTTAADQELIATGLHDINSLRSPSGKTPETMVSLPYRVQELVVGNWRSDDAATVRFGLVNFLFRGTSFVERNGVSTRVLDLRLQRADGTSRQVIVEPYTQYPHTASYLQALHGISLTSDAILDCEDSPFGRYGPSRR